MTIAIAAIAGYVVGAVLAVLLERLYTGAALRGPVLPCAGCKEPAARVAWLGTIGWLVLRGRCPACAAGLPVRVLYLPLLGAAAFGVAGASVDGRRLALTLLFVTPLLALTATDFERHLLPNRIMYPTLAGAAALSWAWPGHSALEMLVGGVVAFAVMFVLFVVLPGFGFGDVRLAGLVGLLSGIGLLLNALMVAAIAAGIGAAFMLVTRRVGRRGVIAYGPYLALSAFWAMLAG